MTAKRIRKFLPVLAVAVFLPLPVLAQIEGPVETGLAQLAKQIVTKSAAAGKTTVAVLPFPNADGSCSVLSNFIADELIQNLFSVPGSSLEIVERAQLETLIKELKLGASGLLNPETTKKLGSQSGVSALTVGTITVIGDTVRINARLIATDTGKAISAAAVDIPKVAAVSELLKQPVSTGPTCAPQKAESAPGGAKPQPSISPTGPNPSSETISQMTFTAASDDFDVQGRCQRSGGSVMCELIIINKADTQHVFLDTGASLYDKDSHVYHCNKTTLAGNQSGGAYVMATLLQWIAGKRFFAMFQCAKLCFGNSPS
jgi:TolB-like protein